MKTINLRRKCSSANKGLRDSCKGLPPFYLHEDFKKKFPELFPGQLIYHYTSVDVLCKLSESSASFYATTYRALNDDSEYEKGVQYVLTKYLPKYQKAVHRLLKKKYPKLYNPDSNGGEDSFIYTPWVMSFSMASDLLSQWIAYTPKKSGGVAIGFDYNNMEAVIGTSVRMRRVRCTVDPAAISYEVHFLPCVYLDDGSEIVKKVLDYLFADYWPKFSAATIDKSDDAKVRQNKKAFAALLVVNLFGAMAKDASFVAEKEFRIIMLAKKSECLKNIELIGGKPRLRVPLEDETKVKINSLISSVMVSPHGDLRLLHSIVDFVKARCSLKFKILDSKSPYNGR